MSDYIKRADVIDELMKLPTDTIHSHFDDGYSLGIKHAIRTITTLPSADAVSREEYEELYHKAEEVNRMANEILADFPSYKELVSVVRCKDCRYYHVPRRTYSKETKMCCRSANIKVSESDFCSYGERAEQTEYKLPGHDEVMEALDKLTIKQGGNDHE